MIKLPPRFKIYHNVSEDYFFIEERLSIMTINKLQTLWNDFASKTGYSRLQTYIVMSENVLQQICSEPSFLSGQELWFSFGGDASWMAMFERRGIPKVLLIKSEGVLEFVSNL